MHRILVIEDSAMMQLYYKQVIAGLPDCQPTFARNGQEALDGIAAKGAPSVIVLDINMPVMDGLEFLARFKGQQAKPPCPVIVVTTEGKDADLKRGMDAGASAYLCKPFKPHQLHGILKEYLRTGAEAQ